MCCAAYRVFHLFTRLLFVLPKGMRQDAPQTSLDSDVAHNGEDMIGSTVLTTKKKHKPCHWVNRFRIIFLRIVLPGEADLCLLSFHRSGSCRAKCDFIFFPHDDPNFGVNRGASGNSFVRHQPQRRRFEQPRTAACTPAGFLLGQGSLQNVHSQARWGGRGRGDLFVCRVDLVE